MAYTVLAQHRSDNLHLITTKNIQLIFLKQASFKLTTRETGELMEVINK